MERKITLLSIVESTDELMVMIQVKEVVSKAAAHVRDWMNHYSRNHPPPLNTKA